MAAFLCRGPITGLLVEAWIDRNGFENGATYETVVRTA
jgi:hypothetical protein